MIVCFTTVVDPGAVLLAAKAQKNTFACTNSPAAHDDSSLHRHAGSPGLAAGYFSFPRGSSVAGRPLLMLMKDRRALCRTLRRKDHRSPRPAPAGKRRPLRLSRIFAATAGRAIASRVTGGRKVRTAKSDAPPNGWGPSGVTDSATENDRRAGSRRPGKGENVG